MVQIIGDESRIKQRKLEILVAQDALLPDAGSRGGWMLDVKASKHLATPLLITSMVNQRGWGPEWVA
jgi:hypothetical protein